ncbi:MAG TPA: glycosyltransferase family 9 protein [Dissulfurispiraceae bacterium]|nr:glycosyltransferase family 9 protein [Dissulfurispiraceae bacterium]
MWKLLLQGRLKRNLHRNSTLTPDDIKNSSTILFSVFSRYGDSVIAFRAINEFMALYAGKSFILVTSPQMVPYARRIIHSKMDLYEVNKRKNPIRFLTIANVLRSRKIDIGLNPWSHGDDSKFFITFAEKISVFGAFLAHSKEYNLYLRAREYLLLEAPTVAVEKQDLCAVSNIVLSPFSTDVTKSVSSNDVGALIGQIRHNFPDAKITTALQEKERSSFRADTDVFVFGKSLKRSEAFLRLLESSDLFIGVDAGPLHLADALGVRTIGIFGPTAPETILDRSSTILTVRHACLNGIFCFVKQCKKPLCIQELFRSDFLCHRNQAEFDRKIRLETEECPFLRNNS